MLTLNKEEIDLLNMKKHGIKMLMSYNEKQQSAKNQWGYAYVQTVRYGRFICNCEACAKVGYPVQNYNLTSFWGSQQCMHGDAGRFVTAVKGITAPSRMIVKDNSKHYILEKHPDDPSGIRFLIISYEPVIKEDSTAEAGVYPELEPVVKNYVDFIPGKCIKGYKVLKRSNKEIPVLDAINLNSCNNRQLYSDVGYEGASSLFDFLDNNEMFAKRSGLYNFFKNTKLANSEVSMFLIYLALIEKYPVMELLVKMGHVKLMDDIMEKVMRCSSQLEIKSTVKDLNKLLNKEETKGSKALRLPKYIADDLSSKHEDLNKYIIWSNIYEISKLSKEQYENFVNSPEYVYVRHTLNDFPNILKYGYNISQLASYIKKQVVYYMKNYKHTWYSYSATNSASYLCGLLRDYLSMCEYNEITPDKKPKDIVKAHNDMTKVIKLKKDESIDKKLLELANYYDSEIKKEPKAPEEETAMGKQFTIIFPKSVNDFVNEGNKMSSCIGHYANKVAKEERVVFFLRNVEEPDESFISAEYVNGNLGQCEYECTIPVQDKEILEYCRVICNKIHRAKLKRDAKVA